MAFEDFDQDMDMLEEPPPTEEAPNRTFLYVAGGLGALLLLSLICMAAYAFLYVPRQRNAQATQVASINAQNTQVAMAAEQTAAAAKITATPTATQLPPTAVPTASPTVVVAMPTSVVGTVTQNPGTATALAQTAAVLQLTLTALGQTATPSASALPTTGFADQVGVPGLIGLALVLIVVIFLTRRLRTASA